MFHTTGYLPRHTDIMSAMSDEVMNLDDAAHEAFPLVAIVIINHNYSEFVGQAIESALAQTYPRTEIYVIDDGSTDNSVEVISSYDEQVHVCVQQNQGVVKHVIRQFPLQKTLIILYSLMQMTI